MHPAHLAESCKQDFKVPFAFAEHIDEEEHEACGKDRGDTGRHQVEKKKDHSDPDHDPYLARLLDEALEDDLRDLHGKLRNNGNSKKDEHRDETDAPVGCKCFPCQRQTFVETDFTGFLELSGSGGRRSRDVGIGPRIWEIRKCIEGLPASHALGPCEIGWKKPSCGQTVGYLLLRKFSEVLIVAIEMDRAHGSSPTRYD